MKSTDFPKNLILAKYFLADLILGLLTIYPESFDWPLSLLPSLIHPLLGSQMMEKMMQVQANKHRKKGLWKPGTLHS